MRFQACEKIKVFLPVLKLEKILEKSSSQRRLGSIVHRIIQGLWIPTFAGMTRRNIFFTKSPAGIHRYHAIFISLLFLFGCLTVNAKVQAQLDKMQVANDEMLTLIISSHDHLRMTPDIDPLKKDFYIVGTSQSSQIHIINGSTSLETQWQIALIPKHDGEIQIPALQVGNEKTEPLIVQVAKTANSNSTSNSTNTVKNYEIFIESSVLPKEAFLQEQFIYTVKLYFARSIENGYLVAPDLPEAKITQNGQDIIYSGSKKGRYYRVLERSYLITPQKTGHLQIQPATLKGYIPVDNDPMDIYSFNNHPLKPIKVSGPVLEINVKPKPASFKGQWLPAKKVTMSETWEPSPPGFRAGEPVTRKIEVSALGASGEQIPNVTVATSKNLNIYPGQPTRDNDIKNNQQVGTLKQNLVFIPTSIGTATIPAVEIHWWNSATKREEVASLPAKRIRVLPALTTSTFSSPTITKQSPSSPKVKPQEIVIKKTQPWHVRAYFWPALAILFIILWIATLLLWHKQKKQSHSQPIKVKVKHQSIKHLRSLLQAACRKNDPREARELFLKWAALYWKNQAIHSLADITTLLEQEHATDLIANIMHLEAVFYSNHQLWEGNAFWESLNNYIVSREAHKQSHQPDPLPPLYCSNQE